MDEQLKQAEQEIRQILFTEFKNHVLYIGNKILDDNISAKDFWKKLKVCCL